MVTRSKFNRRRRASAGQTTIEYLMLLAMAAGTAFLVINGPVKTFSSLIVVTFRSTLANVVQNGAMLPGDTAEIGDSRHPSARDHGKRLH